MPLRPRSEIEHMLPVVHGGEIDTTEGRVPVGGDLLDFSVCTNPLGPPEFVLRDLDLDPTRYPDSATHGLRKRLAERLGLTQEQMVFGNGSIELLRNAALAYFSRGDKALIVGPTFGEYAVACKIAGAAPLEIISDESAKFRLGPDEIVHAALDNGAKGIFLCNPNNPTGQYFGQDAIKWILSRFPDGLLVIDEAYISFAEQAWKSESILDSGNVIVVRSMTKDFALAGLRLGYAIGLDKMMDPLIRMAAPWSVNRIAQQVGERCLELAPEYLVQVRDYAQRGSEQLQRGLRDLGYQVIPSQAHFFLTHVGDGATFQRKLVREGMVVRDCASFGLEAYVRIAPRRTDENDRLLAAIGRIGERD